MKGAELKAAREKKVASRAPGVGPLKLLFIHSRVGRRLVAMFLIAALLPVTVLIAALFVGLDHVLKRSQDELLAEAMNSYSALISERLLRASEALLEVNTNPGDVFQAWSSPYFSTVVLVGRDDELILQRGAPLRDQTLRSTARPQLSNATVVVIDPAARGDVLLARSVGSSDSRQLLLAVVRPAFLWGSDRHRGAGEVEFCVAIRSGGALHCTGSAPDATTQGRVETSSANASAPSDSGQRRDAVSMELLFDGRLAGETWTVTASRSAAPFEQSTRTFRTLAVLAAALATLVALLLSLHQLRRFLVPLDHLLAGARSIADRDFSFRVRVTERDEFGRVATAFNAMAERLGVHFRALSTFSEIDRTILTSPDTGRIAKLAIETLKDITGASVVSVGISEPGTPNQLRIYQHDEKGGEARPPREITWNPDPRLLADRRTYGTWTERPPLPNGFIQELKPSGEVMYFVQAIARSQRVWGLIVLAQREPRDFPNHRRALIRDIADRLAVALSTAERDRRLHVLAHLDGLTGLPNRQRLLAVLDRELAQAHAAERRVGVLFIDLDRFKETNDTLGHAAGDTLLKQTSACIRGIVRDSDVVGRHGGDEFVVLLRDMAEPSDAGVVARKLIKALSKPFDIEGHSVYAGASIGISMYPDDGRDGTDLLKKADTAMYQAKEAGRGRFAYFKQDMNVAMNQRVTLHRELRQALEREEFTLFYQPQVDLRSGRICGAEALVRWRHPARGLLTPVHFIDVCEDTGLIEQVGKWVMHEACLQHGRWRAEGVDVPRVSVNVSSRQLRQPEFVPMVDYTMVRTEMAPNSLEIEVTESLILDGGKVAMTALRALERAGARVAIDDFGTGYSSFTYLKQLPASILKLDKSFVSDIATDSDSATIAAAIINMAHTLRKEVVAEGVETEEQLQFLRRAGCEKVQGYLLSPPVPAERLAELVRICEHGGLAALMDETRLRTPRSNTVQRRPVDTQIRDTAVNSFTATTTLAGPA
jgi:diguanylate cyclase (GGDEF)-like protein